jgi:hypothetical protein
MAAILATVDVEDLATPKVAGIKDALSDLTTHVETFGRTMAGMSGSLQAGADALGASAQQSRAAAQGFQQVQASVNAVIPQVNSLTSGIEALFAAQEQHSVAIVQGAQNIKLYGTALETLSTMAAQGTATVQQQAAALKDLGIAAQQGNGFTKEQARALQELYAQVGMGVALTKEQVAQLEQLTEAYAEANAEALGLGSATERLLAQQSAQAAAAQQAAQGMQVLTDQLQEGAQASTLQKAAFEEITKAAQQMAHISEADKKAFETLNREIQEGGTISKETAAEMQRLNGVMSGQQQAAQGLTVQMLAMGAALAVVAGGVTHFLKESVDLSARVETLGVVMAVTAKNANMTTMALETQVEGIKRLGITTVEATETVLQFVQAQLDVAKSSQLARVAQDLAVVAGIDSSQALDRLLRAINTQQPEMLRSFGLLVSMDVVMRKFAQSTGQTVAQMDPLERKTALLNYVLSEGARAAGAYEASMGTAGKMVGSMTRLVQDLKEKIGDQLLPVWTLLVKGAFELLTVAAKLPEWFYTLAAAVMVAVAAVLALKAAIITGLLPALVTLMGALVSGPGLVLLAIAALTGAYLAFSKAQDVNIQKESEHAAAAEATIKKMEEQVKKVQDLEVAQDKSKDGVKELEQAYIALGKTAPGAVELINGKLVIQYDILAKLIGQQREIQRQAAYTLRQEAERLAGVAAANEKAWLSATKAAQAARAEADALKKGITQPRSVADIVAGLPAASQLLVEAEKHATALDAAAAAALKTWEASGGAATQAARAAREATALVDPLVAQLLAAENAQSAWNEAVKQFKPDRLKAQLRELKTSYEELFDPKTTKARSEEIQKLIAKAVENLAELDKKSSEHQQKRLAAYTAEMERLRGTSAAAEGQLDALEQALQGVAVGSAEWFELMKLGNNSIEFFNKHTSPELIKQNQQVAASAEKLKQIDFAKEVHGWRLEMDATIEAFEKFSEDTLKNLRREIAATAQTDLFADQRARLQGIEDLAQAEAELEAAQADYAQSDKDRALLREHQRMEALERAFALEHRLRELAFMEEEAQLHQKFELMKLEERARLRMWEDEQKRALEAKRTELRARLLETTDPAEIRKIENLMAAYGELYEENQKRAQQRERIFESDVDRLYDASVKELDIRRKTAAAAEDIHRKSLETQRQISAINIQKILEEYDTFLQLGKALLGDLLKASTQTFLAMLSGAEKWSDGFKSILRGLRDAFFSLVDSMIKKWIDEFLKNVLLKKTEDTAKAAADVITGAVEGAVESVAKKGGDLSTAAAGMSKVGAYSAAGTVGGFTGYALGSRMDSRTKGALVGAASGAASGAATGAAIGMMGGPIGAVGGLVIGGIAGAIGGLIGGGKEKREVEAALKDLYKAEGGYQALKVKVQSLGYDIAKLSQATTKETYEAELSKIQTLQKYGGMEALKQVAAMAGYTAKNIEDTFKLTGDYFTKMMDVINGEITKLQQKLEGFRTAAGGLQIRTEGFAESVQQDLQRVWDSAGPDVQKKLEEAYKKAQEKGFSGTQLDYMLKQLQNVAQGAFNQFGFGAAQIAEFNKGLVTAQEEFNRLGVYATATFAGILSSTGDINLAMNSVGDSLDKMIEQQDKLHLQASASISQLLEFRRVIKANEDISKSLTGITQILKGLGDAGALTQEMFSTLGADISSQSERLQARGVDARLSMLMLQPALQKLWEAQKKYGYTVDANTQKLLAQAQAQGLVGEKFKETNEKILDVLLAIADALNAKIPEGLRTTAAVASTTLPDVEAGVNAVTYGHSPGGIEDIVKYLGMATEALKVLHGTSEGTLADTTENADKAAAAIAGMIDPMAAMQAYAGSLTGAGNVSALGGALSSPLGGFLRQRPVAPPEAPVLITAPMPDEDAETTAPDGTPQPSIVINMPITIDASALDGQDMVRVWHDQIVPQLQTDLERNAGQLASFVESRISRYRK